MIFEFCWVLLFHIKGARAQSKIRNKTDTNTHSQKSEHCSQNKSPKNKPFMESSRAGRVLEHLTLLIIWCLPLRFCRCKVCPQHNVNDVICLQAQEQNIHPAATEDKCSNRRYMPEQNIHKAATEDIWSRAVTWKRELRPVSAIDVWQDFVSFTLLSLFDFKFESSCMYVRQLKPSQAATHACVSRKSPAFPIFSFPF